MPELFTNLREVFTTNSVLATIILLLVVSALRWILVRLVKHRADVADDLKYKWVAFVKSAVVALGLVGLILIWAPQLRTFALSLTAVAVAIVIATKELILCISGSLVRASAGTFSIGDLIEFAGHKGYIVDQNLLTTELREYDSETYRVTGKQVILPNSLFLTHSIRHLSLIRPYGIHTLTIYLDPANKPPWQSISQIEKSVRQVIEEVWESSKQEAGFKKILRQHRRALANYRPSVRVSTTSAGKVAFVVGFFCHQDQRAALQENIHKIYFEALEQHENQQQEALVSNAKKEESAQRTAE